MSTQLKNRLQAQTNGTINARTLIAKNKEFSIFVDEANECLVKQIHETGKFIRIDEYHSVTYKQLIEEL